jgi:tetratricopeptide (TPR) repeat protein
VLTRLEIFRVSRGVKMADLAQESGYHRSHVLRIRQATIEPSRDAIAAIVSALRRLTLEDVRAETVFELTAEESGPWRSRGARDFAREAAAYRKQREYALRLLVQLKKHSRSRWIGLLRRTSGGISAAVARAAILEGRRVIDIDPIHSEALLDLGGLVTDEAADLSPEYRAFLGGRARVDRSDALIQLGRYREALPVLDAAERMLEGIPSCTHELGRTWFYRGSVLFKMNGLAEAIHYLRLSVNIFAAVGDHRRIARARFVEGNVLFEEGRWDDARELWLAVEPTFHAGRDRHSLASLWLNLGWCDLERGDVDSARDWLARALDRFSKLRSRTDVSRTKWALGLAEARYGERAAGLLALRHERQEMEKLGVLTEAGMVALDISEILLLDPRENQAEAVEVCRYLVSLFDRAGAKKEVLKALAYLREAANTQVATPELVGQIRREVKRAEREDNYAFDEGAMH